VGRAREVGAVEKEEEEKRGEGMGKGKRKGECSFSTSILWPLLIIAVASFHSVDAVM